MPFPPDRVAPYPYPFHALEQGIVRCGSASFRLALVDCGLLRLESGQLIVCDPFAVMCGDGTDAYVDVSPGLHPVAVTIADVSPALDGSHLREAYASIVLCPVPHVERKQLCLLRAGRSPEPLGEGEIWGFGVDAGTACFVDKTSLERDMPHPSTWYEGLFDDGTSSSWFARMDDPAHLRAGLANLPLPGGDGTTNVVLFHSGWGDGFYPVIGDFDANGELVAVHVDFLVVRDEEVDE